MDIHQAYKILKTSTFPIKQRDAIDIFFEGINKMSDEISELRSKTFTPDEIIFMMKQLNSDQRLDIINSFCKYCGSLDTNCVCWNDE